MDISRIAELATEMRHMHTKHDTPDFSVWWDRERGP